jgi:uncharacterized protein YndB with AHSA1/START domain
MQPREISVEKTISAPPGVIFAILTDPSKHPIIDGSETVRKDRTGGVMRLGPGAKFSMDMHRGLPYRITNTVVEFEEGRLIAWRHFGGHRWRWRLEPLADGRTAVTETFDWSTSIAPRVIERRGYPEQNREGMVATLERLEALVSSDSSV